MIGTDDGTAVGRVARWRLILGPLVLDDTRLDAEIDIQLSDGLDRPQTISIVAHPVSYAEYEEIQRMLGDGADAELRLFWDAADVPNRAEERFALRIHEIRLERGKSFYVLRMDATERAYARLHSTRVVVKNESLAAAVAKIEDEAQVEIAERNRALAGLRRIEASANARADAKAPPGTSRSSAHSSDRHEPAISALHSISLRIGRMARKHGPPVITIWRGRLRVGPDAMEHVTPTDLLADDSGIQAVTPQPRQPGEGSDTGRRFEVVTLGRPDIWPSDQVVVEDPAVSPEADRAGASRLLLRAITGINNAAPARRATLYVEAVHHQLSRRGGFVTRLSAREVEGVRLFADTEAKTAADLRTSAGMAPPHRLATAIRTQIRRGVEAAFATVAEVRRTVSSAQLTTVARGLAPSEGQRGETRTAPIDEGDHTEHDDVPYTTPFAWGKCGLVVPRYPGTRVLTIRPGSQADPVDIGALWNGSDVPESRPGDWWLALPVDVPDAKRKKRDNLNERPKIDKACSDLVDAEGHRTVEARSLAFVAGDDALRKPGERPPTPHDGASEAGHVVSKALRLVHATSGQEIVLRDDGEVAILGKKSGSNPVSKVVLEPGGAIRIEGKTITLDATGAVDINGKAVNINVETMVNVTQQ